MPYKQLLAITMLLSATTLVGCGGGGSSAPDTPEPDDPTPKANYTVLDASAGERVYLNLASGHTVTKDEDWQISYQRFSGFRTNGGDTGDRGVKGCIYKQYDALYDAEGNPVLAEFGTLNAENTLDDFVAIKNTLCSYQSDTVSPYITQEQWLHGEFTLAGPQLTILDVDTNGWIIRSAERNSEGLFDYGFVKAAELNYVWLSGIRQVKFSVAHWDHATQSFSEPETSDWLDFSNETAYWDMAADEVVTVNDDWDLALRREGQAWNIYTNSGVVGAGEAGVGVVIIPNGFAKDVTNPTDPAQILQFASDPVASALSAPGNFGPLEYDQSEHTLKPNFTHYVIKDGDRAYKMQVLSNYGENNDQETGNLYIRYMEIK